MEITPNAALLRAEDPLSKAYQEKLKASEETASPAEAAANGAKVAGDSPAGGDTVTISEEAYKKQQEDRETSAKPEEPAETDAAGRFAVDKKTQEEPEPTNLKEILRKQIREVQKQLTEAQQRLAAAVAEKGQGNAEEAPVEAPEEAAAGSGKGADASGKAPAGDDDVKKCTAEVGQLTATLLQLNNQLMKEEKKAAQAGAMGSAGISSGGTGERGGLGERMSVHA